MDQHPSSQRSICHAAQNTKKYFPKLWKIQSQCGGWGGGRQVIARPTLPPETVTGYDLLSPVLSRHPTPIPPTPIPSHPHFVFSFLLALSHCLLPPLQNSTNEFESYIPQLLAPKPLVLWRSPPSTLSTSSPDTISIYSACTLTKSFFFNSGGQSCTS